jgi:DNA-binding GntR family transcriptional regulator
LSNPRLRATSSYISPVDSEGRSGDLPVGHSRRRARSALRLGELAHQEIKDRLLDGVYAAGQKLSVEELSRELEVSKQPVMEALRLLSADGLVTIIPQVGCRVATYDAQEVRDFFALFASMEGAVAELAAGRRTDADLRALDEISARIGVLVDEEDPAERAHAYRIRNREFHAQIHAMADSAIIADLSQRMWDRSDFLINTTDLAYPLHSVASRHHDHERIRQALHARDGELARRTMEDHILGNIAANTDASAPAR